VGLIESIGNMLDQRIKAYLQRIGFESKPELNFNTLHALQRAHLLSVPYENLNILQSIPISLDINNLYEKIVTRGRGGYCFELNGLFAWLLRSLGFHVVEHMARFFRGKTVPMRCHRVLRVGFGLHEYLCDVGVGGMIPRKPLILSNGEGVTEQNGEHYKLEIGANEYVLCEWRRDNWRKVYSFTEEEHQDIDYIMPSYYCENHPSSPFRKHEMVHIFTKDGRKSVAGRELRIFSNNHVKVLTPATDTAFKELLYIHFGLELQ